MSRVFRRNPDPGLPVAVRSEGVWVEDAEGNRYLDGASGAVAVNIGHGDPTVAAAAAAQAARDADEWLTRTGTATLRHLWAAGLPPDAREELAG